MANTGPRSWEGGWWPGKEDSGPGGCSGHGLLDGELLAVPLCKKREREGCGERLVVKQRECRKGERSRAESGVAASSSTSRRRRGEAGEGHGRAAEQRFAVRGGARGSSSIWGRE